MKLLDIVGARPQFIKVGPILRAVDTHNREHPQRASEAIRTLQPTPKSSAAPYGDERAAERMVQAISRKAENANHKMRNESLQES